MHPLLARLRTVLPAVWLGVLACIAFIAAPAPFAVLSAADAGRVNGRMFASEAWVSLVLALLLLLLERWRARRGLANALNAEVLLLLGSVFCTVAASFAVQPLMQAARTGQTGFGFGQLHALSVGLFGLKLLLIAVLAWRAAASR